MGIGNHELIEHEQNNAERLGEEFIQERREEFEQFKVEVMKYYEQLVVEEFCVNHKDWGQFVLDDYTNSQTYDDDSER